MLYESRVHASANRSAGEGLGGQEHALDPHCIFQCFWDQEIQSSEFKVTQELDTRRHDERDDLWAVGRLPQGGSASHTIPENAAEIARYGGHADTIQDRLELEINGLQRPTEYAMTMEACGIEGKIC